jgi:hypothetical protein
VDQLLSIAIVTGATSATSNRFPQLGDRARETAADDILRAAVVLIHAYLEDLLRTIAATILPEQDEICLDKIPLAGMPGRPEKFSLGKLVQHKGKLVDDVLRQSVSEYLERSNFNNTQEIASFLRTLGFDPTKHNEHFASIDTMIQRRHQIVHRADRVSSDGSDSYVLQPILAIEVLTWLKATHDFMAGLVRAAVTVTQRRVALKAINQTYRHPLLPTSLSVSSCKKCKDGAPSV